MRDIVEHGQTSGSRHVTVLSGCSSPSRLTRWISVATPSTDAGRGGGDDADDVVGRADLVGQLDDVVGALGVDDDDAVGVLGPEGGEVLGPEPLVDGAVAFPEQQAGGLDVDVAEAAEVGARVPDGHVVGAVAELEAGVAAEVLVGEEEDLVALRPAGARRDRGPR